MIRLVKKVCQIIVIFLVVWCGSVAIMIAITDPKPLSNTELTQLSRIDFLDSLTPNQIAEVRNYLHTNPNIKRSFFSNNNLVYTYIVGTAQSADVYASIAKKFNFRSKPYIVTAEDLKSGCPVKLDNRSFAFRFLNYFRTFSIA
jgi:hypothetical protein